MVSVFRRVQQLLERFLLVCHHGFARYYNANARTISLSVSGSRGHGDAYSRTIATLTRIWQERWLLSERLLQDWSQTLLLAAKVQTSFRPFAGRRVVLRRFFRRLGDQKLPPQRRRHHADATSIVHRLRTGSLARCRAGHGRGPTGISSFIIGGDRSTAMMA